MLQRIVAVKILPSHLSEYPETKERFDGLARTISSLNHTNICTLYDVGHQNGVDLPRGIAIIYSRPVIGIVEDARREGSQRLLKVGGQWYHGEKPGVEIFEKAQAGSEVHLITYGCAASAKTCIANPEQSTSLR